MSWLTKPEVSFPWNDTGNYEQKSVCRDCFVQFDNDSQLQAHLSKFCPFREQMENSPQRLRQHRTPSFGDLDSFEHSPTKWSGGEKTSPPTVISPRLRVLLNERSELEQQRLRSKLGTREQHINRTPARPVVDANVVTTLRRDYLAKGGTSGATLDSFYRLEFALRSDSRPRGATLQRYELDNVNATNIRNFHPNYHVSSSQSHRYQGNTTAFQRNHQNATVDLRTNPYATPINSNPTNITNQNYDHTSARTNSRYGSQKFIPMHSGPTNQPYPHDHDDHHHDHHNHHTRSHHHQTHPRSHRTLHNVEHHRSRPETFNNNTEPYFLTTDRNRWPSPPPSPSSPPLPPPQLQSSSLAASQLSTLAVSSSSSSRMYDPISGFAMKWDRCTGEFHHGDELLLCCGMFDGGSLMAETSLFEEEISVTTGVGRARSLRLGVIGFNQVRKYHVRDVPARREMYLVIELYGLRSSLPGALWVPLGWARFYPLDDKRHVRVGGWQLTLNRAHNSPITSAFKIEFRVTTPRGVDSNLPASEYVGEYNTDPNELYALNSRHTFQLFPADETHATTEGDDDDDDRSNNNNNYYKHNNNNNTNNSNNNNSINTDDDNDGNDVEEEEVHVVEDGVSHIHGEEQRSRQNRADVLNTTAETHVQKKPKPKNGHRREKNHTGAVRHVSSTSKRSGIEPQTNSGPLQTSSVPLETSSVPLETSSVPLQTSSVPLQTSSVPLQTSSLPLQTSSLLSQSNSVSSELPPPTVNVQELGVRIKEAQEYLPHELMVEIVGVYWPHGPDALAVQLETQGLEHKPPPLWSSTTSTKSSASIAMHSFKSSASIAMHSFNEWGTLSNVELAADSKIFVDFYDGAITTTTTNNNNNNNNNNIIIINNNSNTNNYNNTTNNNTDNTNNNTTSSRLVAHATSKIATKHGVLRKGVRVLQISLADPDAGNADNTNALYVGLVLLAITHKSKEGAPVSICSNEAWLKVTRPDPPIVCTAFVADVGLDVYVDGARFMPAECTITKVIGGVYDGDFKLQGDKLSGLVTLDSDTYFPSYNVCLQFRGNKLKRESRLVLWIYTVNMVTNQSEFVGCSVLNVFVDKGTTTPCARTLTASEVCVNEGGHQLRLMYASPIDFEATTDMLRTANCNTSDDNDMAVPMVPCASTLVRLVVPTTTTTTTTTTPRTIAIPSPSPSSPQPTTTTNNGDSTVSNPPAYTSGTYLSDACHPTTAEVMMFTTLVLRDRIGITEYVRELADPHVDVTTTNLKKQWLQTQLTGLAPPSTILQPLSLKRIMVYEPYYGIAVAVDQMFKVPLKFGPCYPVIQLISGTTDTKLEGRCISANYNIPWSNTKGTNKSPIWSDGFHVFWNTELDNAAIVLIKLFSVKKIGQAPVLVGWTVVNAMLPGGYTEHTVTLAPLYKGDVAKASLDEFASARAGMLPTLLHNHKKVKQLEGGGHVLLRVADARRMDELPFATAEEIRSTHRCTDLDSTTYMKHNNNNNNNNNNNKSKSSVKGECGMATSLDKHDTPDTFDKFAMQAMSNVVRVHTHGRS